MHIKQIYIVYNEAPYIVLVEDNVQATGVGELSHDLALSELHTYYENFVNQADQEGKFLDFSKGEFINNNQPFNAIIINSAPTPPPVIPVVARAVHIINARTGGDFISLSTLFTAWQCNSVLFGDEEDGLLFVSDENNVVLIRFSETSTVNPVNPTYVPITTNIRVTFKKGAVVLSTSVVDSSTPILVDSTVFQNFDVILIEDDTAPPPPTYTGPFSARSADANVTINDVSLITTAGVVYPVTNATHAGTWDAFAGGTIRVDVTSTKLLEIVVFYNSVAQTERFNLPGTGVYDLTFNPSPANGTDIRVNVRSLN